MRGWRTIAWNVFLLLAAILDGLGALPWATVIPPEKLPWIIFGLAVINLILRAVTTTPIGEKTP